MAKICSLCLTNGSWRYHSIPTAYNGSVGRMCGFIDKLKENRCSELLKLLLNIAVKQKTDLGIRHLASIAVAYASVMFTRDNHNSALQRVITLMAVEGNCNDEFIRRLNRMSLTLSCTGKIKLLDRAANSNRSKLVQCVKDNPMVKITGDNLDMYIRTNHQRQDNQNKDIHWFASNLVASRIDNSNISNESPNIAVEDIAPETFLPNDAEKQHISNVKKVIIGRMISDSEKFDWLKKTLPAHIPNRYKIIYTSELLVHLKRMYIEDSTDCQEAGG